MTATRTRTTLTELETIRLRHLVHDHAGTYYGGPLQLGVFDTVRYVAEGHAERVFPDVVYDTLWDAIRAILNEDITVLDRRLTDADRALAAQARADAADTWMHLAGEALEAADYPLAAAYVDQAERENPADARGNVAREVICEAAAQWAAATGAAV